MNRRPAFKDKYRALVIAGAVALVGRGATACAADGAVDPAQTPTSDAATDATAPGTVVNDGGLDAPADTDAAEPTCSADGWCYAALPATGTFDAGPLPPDTSFSLRSVWVAPIIRPGR